MTTKQKIRLMKIVTKWLMKGNRSMSNGKTAEAADNLLLALCEDLKSKI